MKHRSIINLFWKNDFRETVVNPLINRSNIIQIYWYRFLGSRKELSMLIGKLSFFTKRSTYLDETVVCIKKKVFGITLTQYFPMNSPVVVAMRVIL